MSDNEQEKKDKSESVKVETGLEVSICGRCGHAHIDIECPEDTTKT